MKERPGVLGGDALCGTALACAFPADSGRLAARSRLCLAASAFFCVFSDAPLTFGAAFAGARAPLTTSPSSPPSPNSANNASSSASARAPPTSRPTQAPALTGGYTRPTDNGARSNAAPDTAAVPIPTRPEPTTSVDASVPAKCEAGPGAASAMAE